MPIAKDTHFAILAEWSDTGKRWMLATGYQDGKIMYSLTWTYLERNANPVTDFELASNIYLEKS